MKNIEINELMNMVQNLSSEMQKELVENIMTMLGNPSKEPSNSCESIINKDLKGKVPHCHAESKLGLIVKRGFNKNGVQRYYCKHCKKIFVATTNTAFEFTRKKADTWRKFIYLTINGKSLHDCARECKIAYQTAFTWRHKVLNVFAVDQNNIDMKGTVEMDEMLMPISYKGNHVKGKIGEPRRKYSAENDMPRPAFKRGSDNKSSSSKDKVCVFCMIEDGNKTFYANTPGVGFMQKDMLNATVAKHVDKTTATVLVDEYKVTANYLKDKGYNYKTLKSNTSDNRKDHRPQIDGDHHLQHVNAMHHHLRVFLAPYHGVSSKYLNNYVSMFVWLKNIKKSKKLHIEDVSISRAASADCYITRSQLEEYPAIPKCA